MLCVQTAAAIRTGNDLQQMSVWIIEIEAPPVVPVIDRVGLSVKRVRPIGNPALAKAREDSVELILADQKGKVARGDIALGLDEIQGRLAYLHDSKMRERFRWRKSQDLS